MPSQITYRSMSPHGRSFPDRDESMKAALPLTHIVAGMVLLSLMSFGCSSSGHKAAATRQAEIQRVQAVLGMAYPYRVKSWGYYLDGGTTGVSIVDRWGRTLEFSVDGRLQPTPIPTDTVRLMPRHFFLGGTHPDVPGARRLPIDGPEEQAILDMLETISLDYFAQGTIDRIYADRDSLAAHWSAPQYTRQVMFALRVGSLAWNRRRLNLAGEILWVRNDTSGRYSGVPTNLASRKPRVSSATR